MSSEMEPVGMTRSEDIGWNSTSPSRMIEPFTNCFSMPLRVRAMAFSRSVFCGVGVCDIFFSSKEGMDVLN